MSYFNDVKYSKIKGTINIETKEALKNNCSVT